MVFEERTYDVLLVSASGKFNTAISGLLPESYYSHVTTVKSISSAKRAILERAYDIVMINAPLPDDFGTRFAIDVCDLKRTTALLIVKADVHDEIRHKVVRQGVFTLPKPTSSQMISQAVMWMEATCERLRRLDKKTVKIEDKMKEIRQVNRAKWLLIDHLKMSEEDAHRYIEKQAMDRCVTKKEIAEGIIKTYGM